MAVGSGLPPRLLLAAATAQSAPSPFQAESVQVSLPPFICSPPAVSPHSAGAFTAGARQVRRSRRKPMTGRGCGLREVAAGQASQSPHAALAGLLLLPATHGCPCTGCWSPARTASEPVNQTIAELNEAAVSAAAAAALQTWQALQQALSCLELKSFGGRASHGNLGFTTQARKTKGQACPQVQEHKVKPTVKPSALRFCAGPALQL